MKPDDVKGYSPGGGRPGRRRAAGGLGRRQVADFTTLRLMAYGRSQTAGRNLEFCSELAWGRTEDRAWAAALALRHLHCHAGRPGQLPTVQVANELLALSARGDG